MTSRIVRCLCFVTLFIAVSARSWGAPIYTFTTIDVPGSIGASVAQGINDAGQIVGYFEDATGLHGFLKDGANFTTIDVPGASLTIASGINDAGQIVGDFLVGRRHGFLLDGATFTTIDVPRAASTSAAGINNAGQIVGTFFTLVAFRPNFGFLLDGATLTTIVVPRAASTSAAGINNAGQIVGSADSAGFLLDGATFTTIDVPGAVQTRALAINDSGEIVGTFCVGSPNCFIGNGTDVHGFLKDGATFTTIDVPGAVQTRALAINDAGEIVGEFCVVSENCFGTSTATHGFLATPVPEPATWLLFGSGLVGLVRWRRRPAVTLFQPHAPQGPSHRRHLYCRHTLKLPAHTGRLRDD